MDTEKTVRFLSREELSALCKEALQTRDYRDKRILVVIPDTTRSGPVDIFFRSISEQLLDRTRKLDFIVALGTHPILDETKLYRHLGITREERETKYREVGLFQHRWDDPEELRCIGTIPRQQVRELSKGLLDEDIPVEINRRILQYDELLIVGPVFPHEVVGFSGGYKYIFPGVAGPQIIHKFHWLGALITNPKINGVKDTPPRQVINKAVSLLRLPITLFSFVEKGGKVLGFFAGGEESWSKAADLSAQVNIQYVDRTFHTVLSVAPQMYEDLWTAGKCMYKLEPIVEDGGRLIIYAPHVREVSYTHGEAIEKVGYHTRDYFLKQMDRFRDVPGAIMAHSTHVKGIGTFIDGKETPRIEVLLATGIPKHRCRKINLGYLDPDLVRIEDYVDREDEGILVVRNAGEVLYRLASGKVPDIEHLYSKRQ
ncbi:MAG: hypothetical protein B1H40_03930 [Candidatus Latescibacteria bacterium 4484_181]|nr:MAG: hypothetical protein B1H40_03930 [Candidatus Latescibacteria bacterium 4484_181]RKY72962.1 MAG: hypothetical protein DRQ24_03810 [Candidatus Latescibacterota bacterium]